MLFFEFYSWDRAYWEFGKGKIAKIKHAEIIIGPSSIKNLNTLIQNLVQT